MTSFNRINLCEVCKNIDFVSLIYSSPVRRPAPSDVSSNDEVETTRKQEVSSVSLGTLEEIAARVSQCGFCRLFTDTARQMYSRYFDDDEEPLDSRLGLPVSWDGKPITVTLEREFLCLFEPLDNTPDKLESFQKYDSVTVNRLGAKLVPCPWRFQEFHYNLSFQPFWADDVDELHPKSLNPNSTPDITELNLDEESSHQGTLGTGRLITKGLDMNLVKRWLHECETEHAMDCTSPKWIPGNEALELKGLRVIDVFDECLINAPRDCRYLALSYVWGALDQQIPRERYLSRDKLLAFGVKGSIGNQLRLPATIRDSMEFTKRLGERYLWVDALCIVQDDELELLDITAQMDIVYGRALLVIIAGAGVDADFGLPGIQSSKLRPVSQRYAKVSLVQQSAPNDLAFSSLSIMESVSQGSSSTLQFSAWNSRGWTFQERLLARRAIIFTEYQIYWVCERSMWAEETHLELRKELIEARPRIKNERKRFFLLPQRLGCNDEWDDGYPKFTRQALNIYITQFSTRNFTFPGDKRIAFSGIERRCSFLTGVKFHWGLTEDMFDQDLLFTCSSSTTENLSYQLALEQGGFVQVAYPSWSWMAWRGFVGAKIYNRGLHRRRLRGTLSAQPLILFYSLLSDGSFRAITEAITSVTKRSLDVPRSETKDTQIASESDTMTTSSSDEDQDNEEVTSQDMHNQDWLGQKTLIGPVDLVSRLSGKSEYVDASHAEHAESTAARLDSSFPADGEPLHETGKLIFWTSHARVFAKLDERGSRYHVVAPADQNKRDCEGSGGDEGRVNMSKKAKGEDDDAAELAETQKPQLLDCIVVASQYGIGETNPNGMLALLIVQWHAEYENVCCRIGVTEVSIDDWIKYEPNWKLVVLE